MANQDFIFSNKVRYRLLRHLSFWAVYYVYTVLNSLSTLKITAAFTASLFRNTLNEALQFLPLYLFSVYFSIYFILPQYARKRNIFLFLSGSFFLLLVAFIPGHFITQRYLETTGQPVSQGGQIIFFLGKCFGELIIITGAAVIIRIMKDYSLKQKENERLVAENVSNKLQLLKMKIHPRILFECLQNVYRDIETGNEHAPEMILKLSELLNYLLYEGQQNQISLNKEIQMIQNYIELKKLEYKSKLDVQVALHTGNGSFDISPGLFLPFLEIAILPFGEPEKPLCISVELGLLSSELFFIIKNNVAGEKVIAGIAASSILENTKKRLEIFYPRRHTLQVYHGAGDFNIKLQIELNPNTHYRNMQRDENLIYEHT